MHMADALVSPEVGGALWIGGAGLIAYSSRKVAKSLDDARVPLMGVLGAFVFTAQMINFSIPGTGSSGHLGGGLLLAILLGPHAAFLVVASVLTIQALFFADGGLLALGCNMVNLGFFPAFIAYPLFFRPLAGDLFHAPPVDAKTRRTLAATRVTAATVVAAVIGLQLGALAVVLETTASGIARLPFRTFVLLMQPVHLAIGIVEGVVTAGVVGFVVRVRPEVLSSARTGVPSTRLRPLLLGLLVAAAAAGTTLAWFASPRPDGLEWAVAKAGTGDTPERERQAAHGILAAIQRRISFLPDYGFRRAPAADSATPMFPPPPPSWPAVDPATSVSGIVGGACVLLLVFGIGALLRAGRARHGPRAGGGPR